MKKNIFIILIILLIVVLSITITFVIRNDKSELIIKLTGEDISQMLNLSNCNEVFICSFKYVYNGKLNGDEQYYVIKKDSKNFKKILSLIKVIESEHIELIDYKKYDLRPVTHSIDFIINKPMSALDYSIVENKLVFKDLKTIAKWTGYFPRAIILKMDEEFKEQIINLDK